MFRNWSHQLGQNKLILSTEIINKSYKVVVLFSKGFMKDAYNKYLSNYAFLKKLDKNSLIPICMPGCYKPDILLCIHHLELTEDWRNDEQKWNLLIRAILERKGNINQFNAQLNCSY
jgi:hypothetical protein